MKLLDIQKKLKELSDLTNEDYYVKFYADGSSSVHIVGDDVMFFHAYTNEFLMDYLCKKIWRLQI